MNTKLDGFYNVLSGLNLKQYDKHANNEFKSEAIVPDSILMELTTGEGIAKRAVDVLSSTMLKEGFFIKNDADGMIMDKLEELEIRKRLSTVLKWSFGLGGGVILMGIDDGGELFEPINESTIKNVKFLKVFDKTEIMPTNRLYGTIDENYNKTEIWTINTAGLANQINVHESRLLFFDGEQVTNLQRYANNGWGYSIFQASYNDLQDLLVSWAYCPRLLSDFIKKVTSMDNLLDMVTNGQEEQVKKRLRLLDLTSDVMNREVIDRNLEEFRYETASLTGAVELVDKTELRVSAVWGIPLSILFGQTPQGFNSTGKGEEEMFYDKVSGLQGEKLTEPLSRLIRFIQLSTEGPTKGKEVEGWNIKYNPMKRQTQKEILESRKLQSDIDISYISNAVLGVEEVRASRFGGADYSFETTIDDNLDTLSDLDNIDG